MNREKVIGILAIGIGLVLGIHNGLHYFMEHAEMTRVLYFKSHVLFNVLWPLVMCFGAWMYPGRGIK